MPVLISIGCAVYHRFERYSPADLVVYTINPVSGDCIRPPDYWADPSYPRRRLWNQKFEGFAVRVLCDVTATISVPLSKGVPAPKAAVKLLVKPYTVVLLGEEPDLPDRNEARRRKKAEEVRRKEAEEVREKEIAAAKERYRLARERDRMWARRTFKAVLRAERDMMRARRGGLKGGNQAFLPACNHNYYCTKCACPVYVASNREQLRSHIRQKHNGSLSLEHDPSRPVTRARPVVMAQFRGREKNVTGAYQYALCVCSGARCGSSTQQWVRDPAAHAWQASLELPSDWLSEAATAKPKTRPPKRQRTSDK